jgi:hypothetical protein
MGARPSIAGVVACLAVVGIIVGPYLVLPSTAVTGLNTYYASGVLETVLVAALSGFALVTAVAFGGVARGRAGPALVAGLAAGVGGITTLLAVQWAVAVDPATVASVGRAAWLDWHRWIVALVTATVPATGVWTLRATGR